MKIDDLARRALLAQDRLRRMNKGALCCIYAGEREFAIILREGDSSYMQRNPRNPLEVRFCHMNVIRVMEETYFNLGYERGI